jgi:hypothetical protein
MPMERRGQTMDVEVAKKERLNSRTAWRENLRLLAEIQKKIDMHIEQRVLPSEELAEQYAQSLQRAARHFQKYYRASQVVDWCN